MKLSVPLEKQPEGSEECGILTVSMLLQYYGETVDLEQLRRELPIEPGIGTYTAQLGIIFLKRGYEVNILLFHPKLFTLKDKQLSTQHVLDRIVELGGRSSDGSVNTQAISFFKEFVHLGGTFTAKIPEPEDVRAEIQAKRPLISLLTTNFLKGEKPRFNSHFNVITGMDEKRITVNDPLRDARGGEQTYNIKDYFYGIYASTKNDLDSGSLITIKPRT